MKLFLFMSGVGLAAAATPDVDVMVGSVVLMSNRGPGKHDYSHVCEVCTSEDATGWDGEPGKTAWGVATPASLPFTFSLVNADSESVTVKVDRSGGGPSHVSDLTVTRTWTPPDDADEWILSDVHYSEVAAGATSNYTVTGLCAEEGLDTDEYARFLIRTGYVSDEGDADSYTLYIPLTCGASSTLTLNVPPTEGPTAGPTATPVPQNCTTFTDTCPSGFTDTGPKNDARVCDGTCNAGECCEQSCLDLGPECASGTELMEYAMPHYMVTADSFDAVEACCQVSCTSASTTATCATGKSLLPGQDCFAAIEEDWQNEDGLCSNADQCCEFDCVVEYCNDISDYDAECKAASNCVDSCNLGGEAAQTFDLWQGCVDCYLGAGWDTTTNTCIQCTECYGESYHGLAGFVTTADAFSHAASTSPFHVVQGMVLAIALAL